DRPGSVFLWIFRALAGIFGGHSPYNMGPSGGGGDVTHSQTLHFSSDGMLLACAGANAVTVVDAEGNQHAIPQRGAAAIAVFAGQIWTLDEQRTHLQRFHTDGRALGAPHEVAIAPVSSWIASTTGVPAVLMQGTGRRLIVDDSEALFEKEVPAAGVTFPL